ncbi:MAG: AsmA family protein [Thermodesulfobacteriota bacterium]|nr:AsmA family protein [Thermodesulfobacteriota bacterium]
MSNRVRRYLGLFILGLFLVCVVLVVLANVLVTPERIRNTFVPVVEKYLECKVNLERVDISLFTSATLTRLELLNRDDHSLLLAADKVVLRYQLWPLLTRRIVIDEIRLEHPRVNVERYSDGSFNLQNLFEQKSGMATDPVSSATAQKNDVNILISKLYINRGELLFKDYKFNTVPHRYKLTDFDLYLTDFSFQNDFSFKLWGKVNSAPIDAEGSINIKHERYDLDLVVEQMDMAQFQPYYRTVLNGCLDRLKFGIDGHFWGTFAKPNSVGVIQLHHLDLTSKYFSRYPLRADEILIDYNIAFDHRRGDVDIKDFQINYDGVKVKLDGHVCRNKSNSDIDVHVFLPNWSLRTVLAELPPALVRPVSGYDLAGSVDIQMVLRGNTGEVKQLIREATISLDAVQGSVGELRPSVTGVIAINGKALTCDGLNIVIGDNTLQLELSSANLWAKRPMIQAGLRAKQFDSSLLSSRIQLRQDDAPHGGLLSVDSTFREAIEPGPVDLPIDIRGDIIIDHASFQQFDVAGLRTNFEIRNNLLEYDHLTAQIANGVVDASGLVDLSRQGFAYAGRVAARNINLELLVQQLDTDYVKTLSGMMNATVDYSGAGTQKLRIQQNLSATGMFTIDHGKMAGTALIKQLAAVLQTSEFDVFRFDQAKGRFSLETGGHLDYTAEFVGSRSRLYPVGYWLFDGSLLADLDVYLSPEVVARLEGKSTVISYLQNEQGWGLLPLKVAGTIDSPAITINFTKVGQTAVGHGGEKLKERLKEKLGDEAGTVLSNSGVELIESAIQGLLGQ